ncbi:MAG TPA: HAD-IC family P-type ATPase [Patescibacteria group bacterium]
MIQKELWYNLSVSEILKKFKTSQAGLSQKEAVGRLKKFGPNELPREKRLTWFKIFLSQFKSPLVYILLLAAVITLILQEFIDMAVIIAAVFINVIVGFFQEYKADQALWQLKKLTKIEAKVIRQGILHQIDSAEIAPGDIIIFEAGDKIPADGRLIEVNNLEIAEAALTGESVPSTKIDNVLKRGTALADRENMVYMGTTVERGKGRAVVTATGVQTEIGRIAVIVREIPEEKSPLQKKLKKLTARLTLILGVISAGIFTFGFLTGQPFFEMLITTVALAVAAIPQGLPASVSIILAIGMQKILKRKGLVRQMVAAETLGATTVICTDKTGTLTKGVMRVSQVLTGSRELLQGKHKVFTLPGRAEEIGHILALEISLLCNNSFIENPEDQLKDWIIRGDSTETALLLAAVQAGLNRSQLEKESPRLAEVPFDSEKKYMVTMNKLDSQHNILYLKGAPEVILEMSSAINVDGKESKLTPNKIKILKKTYEDLTRKGLRVLGVGYRKVKIQNSKALEELCCDFIFVGFIGLKDPLRKEAKETLRKIYQAGIRPVVVTGDHKLTARAIFEELGFPVKSDRIMEGVELDQLSDAELKQKITEIDVFARVEPKHKIRIVDAWQARGQVVAMTGDGVNDAPALKSADIGVALGSGTDVAKETADIVVTDDNLSTLVAAVEQGRIIFENIRKVTLYFLIDSFTEIILIGGSLLLGLPLPLLAAQILWVNLVEDSFPSIALAFEPGEREVMKDRPRKLTEPILDTEIKVLIFVIGIITDLFLFLLFIWLLGRDYSMEYIRTIIFITLGLDSLFYVFSCRSFRHTIFTRSIFTNKLLIAAVLTGMMFILIGVYMPIMRTVLRTVPLSFSDWLIPVGLSVLGVILIEITKEIFIIRGRRKKFSEAVY